MLREMPKQRPIYSFLYERVPEDYLLKRIENAVGFALINDLLADSYSKNNGPRHWIFR